jgi:hypothetical protein
MHELLDHTSNLNLLNRRGCQLPLLYHTPFERYPSKASFSPLNPPQPHLSSVFSYPHPLWQGFDQDDDDDASSIGSGMTESVSGMSVSSRAAGAAANPYAMARPSAQRSGLGSVLGGGAPSYRPAAFGQMQRQASFGATVGCQPAHSLLEVAVHSAGVRSKYRKTLSNPIFTVSVSWRGLGKGWVGSECVCVCMHMCVD